MNVKTTRWDSAEHLKTDEDMQLYLEACFEEAGDDPAFIVHALGVIARARNMSQLARDTGLTREGLYKALSPEGNPTFSTVAKVARALGLQITVQTASSTPLRQEKRITDSAST
jgi:probable addiction module antidote protein